MLGVSGWVSGFHRVIPRIGVDNRLSYPAGDVWIKEPGVRTLRLRDLVEIHCGDRPDMSDMCSHGIGRRWLPRG